MGSPESSILGTGWSFPPTFSRRTCSVDMVSDELDIQQSLRVLFATAVGERIMLPEYGSQLSRMVFRGLTTTRRTEIAEGIRLAVLYWEPRIDADEVGIQPATGVDGLVLITLNYTIRRTNARSNLVYPFYLWEGTLPAQLP